MEKIEFEIQGSEAEPYQVVFKKEGTAIKAYCTCKAAQKGMYCKHRLDILLDGKDPGIVSGNGSDIKTVASWLPGSNLEMFRNDIQSAERNLENVKRELANLKKRFAHELIR